nr:EamA family transporter [Chloroflexaceae bacterium]
MVTQSQPTTGLSRFGLPVNDLSMVLVVLIWGLNFSVSKLSLGQFPPLAFAALRFTIGALLLAVIL